MADSNATVVETLNRLLRAEYESPIPRLAEAAPFVNWPAAADRARIEPMLKDARSHEQALTELILKLRGAPAPPRYETRTGGMHYVDLVHLMPGIIDGLRRLIRAYESVGITGNAEADALIANNLSTYQHHLANLVRTHTNLVSTRES